MTYYKINNNFKESLTLIDQQSYDYPIKLNEINIKKLDGSIETIEINPMESYFLKGKTGRGKTAIAIHIAKNWLEQFEKYQNDKYIKYQNGESAYTYRFEQSMYLGKVNFVQTNDLIKCIEDAFSGADVDSNVRKEAKRIYERYCEIPLLIVDDLGKTKLTEFRIERVFDLFNKRFENSLQTVITTNFTMNELNELGYSQALLSRIFSLCSEKNIIEIYSPIDYRMTSVGASTNFEKIK